MAETAASDTQPANADPAPATAARDRLVIWILLISTFVVILNETIMSVALPPLMVALDVSAGAVQWLTTAFLLTMAVIIPVTGFLIQRIHTKPLFILAMSLFSLGTLMGALAPGLEILIFARVVQAGGTAIMLPLLMTTVMTLVPPQQLGRTMGTISIVISVAPALGPAISGVILHFLDWRFMFWLVLPIALAALVLGGRRIENVTEPRFVPVDLLSVLVSAIAFGGLVYGLSSFGVPAGTPPVLPAPLSVAMGAVAMGVFVWRQIALQKGRGPLLDLRTFASRNFSVAVVMMGIAMMALLGTVILLPIYMQDVIGLDTLRTGLLLMPGGLVMGLLGPQVGKLYDRFGPSPLIVPGAFIVSAVLWLMTLLGPDTHWGVILAGHIAISIGLAFVFTPLFTVSLASVNSALYSHGSAILGSIQQLAGAAGVALFIAVMSARSAGLVAEGMPQRLALSHGITAAFTIGAVISVLALIAAFFVRRAPIGPIEEAV